MFEKYYFACVLGLCLAACGALFAPKEETYSFAAHIEPEYSYDYGDYFDKSDYTEKKIGKPSEKLMVAYGDINEKEADKHFHPFVP